MSATPRQTILSKAILSLGAAALSIALLPTPASAGTYLTPFAGVTFKGASANDKFSTGVGLTFMGALFGLELEANYTPDFFGEQSGLALIAKSNVVTATGDLVVGLGAGRVHPYVVAGMGLLRTRINSGSTLFQDVHTNDLALDAGVGVIGMFSKNVGLRGDLRYFRRLQDPSGDNTLDVSLGTFHYWRATGGITFKF